MIASREGIACQSEAAMTRCTQVLDAMRNNARFSLKVVTVNGPMPHNKELQVQAGGMLALQKLVNPDLIEDNSDKQGEVFNIHQTLGDALQQYASLEALPYGEIVKDIVKYQSRPKRRKK